MTIISTTIGSTPPVSIFPVERDLDWLGNEDFTSDIVRLSVQQYEEMVARGIIQENNQIEFLEGILVYKMTKKPAHWIAAKLVSDALEGLKVSGYFVHRQDPVDTSDSVPEPDAALVRGEPRNYIAHNPQSADSCLVVEVADSSLARDRGWKKRIYSRAGVPIYWIVNLIDRQVEVFAQPSGPAEKPDYAERHVVAADGTVSVVVDGQEVGRIAVKDILP